MKATAKEKWTALLKSLWTPTVYMLLQLVVSLLIILPLTVSALSTMMKENNPLQFDFGAHVYKLYSSPAIVNAAMVLAVGAALILLAVALPLKNPFITNFAR